SGDEGDEEVVELDRRRVPFQTRTVAATVPAAPAVVDDEFGEDDDDEGGLIVDLSGYEDSEDVD
ncbi:UNVERIFIED_CONTAM: hypothetical protein HDU68_009126, partial [Siphonaria sp. JEL0065]